MKDDAIFRLASVSKVFVSIAAMVLVEQGRLGLDDFLADHLPVFASQPAITLLQLLSHTAGFGYRCLEPDNGPYHHAGISDGLDHVELSLAENMRRLAGVALLYPPGSAWGYSLSIDVVGAVIESVTDKPLPDAVRDLVCAPLGLSDAAFHAVDRGRLTTAYVEAERSPRLMTSPDRIPIIDGLSGLAIDPARALDPGALAAGGSGMVASADDVINLLEAMRTGAKLLSTISIGSMALDHAAGHDMPGWPGWGHGLGFAVLRDPALSGTAETVGTWRWGGAYGHSWFVDPAAKLSVVALTNTAPSPMTGDAFAHAVRDACYATRRP